MSRPRNGRSLFSRDKTQADGPAAGLLSSIIESSNDAIVSKTLDGVVVTWNRAAERMFGYSAEEMIGASIRRLIPADRQAEEDEFLARIRRGERVDNFETIRLRKDGSPVDIAVTVSPVLDENGAIVGASKIAREITDRKRQEQQLRESEENFRTLADNISQLAWMADKKGWIFWYNKRWFDYTGTTLEEMQGWGWRGVHHPDHIDGVVSRIQHSWDTGEPWEDTFPLRGANGEYRWFLSRALPIRDARGEIVRWFGTNTDITDQMEREERIKLLMGEVNHRSKNMLALVQAIARRTAASDPQDFTQKFGERIQALAASQDLLIHGHWRGVSLDDLVRSQLGHFKDLIGARISIDGPPVRLVAAAAQALGMALHELGTNAGKYGALSTDNGCIDIAWSLIDAEDGARRFALDWTESGGPPIAAPTRRGFGTIVIEGMAKMALNAEVELTFGEAGLHWRLACDDARVVEGALTRAGAVNGAHHSLPCTGRNVLVVEDEALVALDVMTALEGAGFTVIGPASTVARAMELLDANACDFAVLDINLGAENAAPVAERLTRNHVPFIVVSGYARDQQPIAFADAPFLAKPMVTAQLLAEIDRRMVAAPNGLTPS
ncbi:MAG: MEKHLA domain-containing protein [Alphaproteobacteria bacterium]|nr:MEKHLA domain-containing protein [Alphaproteobacteria bacterium]